MTIGIAHRKVYLKSADAITEYGKKHGVGKYLFRFTWELMRNLDNRPGQPGNRVIPITVKQLQDKLGGWSNNLFYRVLKVAYECGLVDLGKVKGRQGYNRNTYTLNHIPKGGLRVIRSWEDRREAVFFHRETEYFLWNTGYKTIKNYNAARELHYRAKQLCIFREELPCNTTSPQKKHPRYLAVDQKM